MLCAGCLLALARYSGDLPSCFGREVSGGVWPLLGCSCDLPSCVRREGVGREASGGGVWPLLCAGPSPCRFCAGVRLCSGPALTMRGRHTQRLVYPTWARSSAGDQPLLRWAHDLRMSGPYFALGRDRATFAMGPGPLAMPSHCAELPGPRLATYASARVSYPGPFLASSPILHWACALLVCAAHLGRQAELCPHRLGARLAGYPARAGLEPTRTLRLPLRPGARDESVARPTLALRVIGSRLCTARIGPEVLRLRLRRPRLLLLYSTRGDK